MLFFFERFKTVGKKTVSNRIHSSYLFIPTPWIYDNASGSFTNISNEFKMKPNINLPNANAAAAAMELYNQRQNIVDQHNKKYMDLPSAVRSIMDVVLL